MMTTIVVILIVWVVLSVPVSFVAARMLRSEHRNTGDPSTTGADEFHPGRSLR
ncbi:hypothetical protein ACFWUP_12275 [Nocardia sp. NPDC058658]|uniref:hypothetical protein n=1 Tax=Nocardia sp. NPDC058658 TaxID=3346580 RepID=UPI00365EAE2B